MNEEIIAGILCGICLLPGVIISIVLLTGRGASLISGFNTLPKHKQDEWDKVAMCRFVGVLLLAFLFLLTGAIVSLLLFGNFPLFIVCMVAGMIALLLGILYLNKSKRFKL